jgi:hypothetical protein
MMAGLRIGTEHAVYILYYYPLGTPIGAVYPCGDARAVHVQGPARGLGRTDARHRRSACLRAGFAASKHVLWNSPHKRESLHSAVAISARTRSLNSHAPTWVCISLQNRLNQFADRGLERRGAATAIQGDMQLPTPLKPPCQIQPSRGHFQRPFTQTNGSGAGCTRLRQRQHSTSMHDEPRM